MVDCRMADMCGCCTALKPRYKRLVDNIFPAAPEEGLVKSNMEKLTFYALSSRPEKLDRIGQYLERKLSHDINRNRIQYVFISMDILDQLMVSCHAHSLNLFVESFLKMVQKLLESGEPNMQIRGIQSFVKFANVEEDAPSYHRRYDFFVSKFSSLCHSNYKDPVMREKLRQAGLRGLQGVVRKTISDDLQVNIWEAVHMDKIVPSLLYNMQDHVEGNKSPKGGDSPCHLAEMVFRDLICRASYGNIRSVLAPVLVHLDNHNLWVPNDFAIRVFKIIMFSVQNQYGYLVVQMLLAHVDKHAKSDPRIKTCIVTVLYEAVLISSGNSTGPSVLEVFNNLLRHLRISIDRKSSELGLRNEEIKFEEVVVNTIGEFANNLPDYQKIEIMMFIMGKFPNFTSEDDPGRMDKHLFVNLLRTILKVATKYKTVSFSAAFPPEFLHPLLRISLIQDPGMRIIVQEILHTLLDRHGNSHRLRQITLPKDITTLHLTKGVNTRQECIFMKKSGMQLYWHILENVQLVSNRVDNFEAIYCTMCLLCLEVGQDEIIIELVRLALDIQQVALNNISLPMTHLCAIHSIVAAFLNFLGQITNTNSIYHYVQRVVENRELEAPYLLPGFAFNRGNQPSSYPKALDIPVSCLFYQEQLADCLRGSSYDVTRLNTPFSARPIHTIGGSGEGSTSVSDLESITIEFESSFEGSLHTPRKKDEITVDSLKRMLAEDSTNSKAEEERHRQEVVNMFRSAPFEDIVANSEAKSNHFHSKLAEILDMVSHDKLPAESPQEMVFPKLFVY